MTDEEFDGMDGKIRLHFDRVRTALEDARAADGGTDADREPVDSG